MLYFWPMEQLAPYQIPEQDADLWERGINLSQPSLTGMTFRPRLLRSSRKARVGCLSFAPKIVTHELIIDFLRSGPRSANELARRCEITEGSAWQKIEAMIKIGLVSRCGDANMVELVTAQGPA